jgi:hypothetical protein
MTNESELTIPGILGKGISTLMILIRIFHIIRHYLRSLSSNTRALDQWTVRTGLIVFSPWQLRAKVAAPLEKSARQFALAC